MSLACIEASRRNAEIANTVNKRLATALIVVTISLSVVIAFDKWLDYKSVYIPTIEQSIEHDGYKTNQKQNGVD